MFARVRPRFCEIFDVASFPLISRSCEFVCAIKFNRIVVHVSQETVQRSHQDDVFSLQMTVAEVTLCVCGPHRGRRGIFTQNTLSHAFSHAHSLSGSHPSLTFHAFAWLKMKPCALSKTVHTSRNMSHITSELASTFALCTSTPSYHSARLTSTSPNVHSHPCHDPQQGSIGCMADVPPTTESRSASPFGREFA